MKRTVLATLVLIGTACAPASSPILVGAVYPTGGSQGMGGVEEFRGVRLAAQLVNREGGVEGRPIELVPRPADSADGAPRAVREAAEAGTDLVLGSYGSTISAPAASVASQLDVVFWETGAVGEIGEDVALGERFFRAVSPGASLGEAAIAFVDEQLLPLMREGEPQPRYGVAYVDDVYGRAVGLGAVEAIQDRGLPLADVFPYDLDTVDYERLASKIARSGTDILMVSAYLADGIELRRAMVRAGVPLVASIGTSSSYCMPAFGNALGGDAVGLFASDKPDADVLDPASLSPEAGSALEWAQRAYAERWGGEMPAPALSGFAAAWVLFKHVLPAADGTSPDAIRDAALDTRLPVGSLPNGSGLAFAPSDHPEAGSNLRATSVIWEWVQPGERAIVWPPELASSPILPLPIS